MDESIFQQPDPELLRLFRQGDPFAIDAVMRLVLPQLYSWGQRHYPPSLQDEVRGVIHEVSGETCHHYQRYDPSRAKFTTYVIDLIARRMTTVQRKQFRRLTNEEHLEHFSEKTPEPVYNDSETEMIQRLDREEFFQFVRRQLTETEAAFLDLMLAGEIHQEPFIATLTRTGDVSDAGRVVNNVKGRVKYKLQKAAHERGLRLEDLL